MADLPDGRDRWIRWDQELTSTCPECGRVWADHPEGIQLWAQDGHLGRVLPECPQELGRAHLLNRAARLPVCAAARIECRAGGVSVLAT